MDFQEIIAGTVGKENTFGTCVGLIKPEQMSFARFSTDDTAGNMRGYVGEGRFTDDPLNTFGGAGVVEIPSMQKLLHFICERGFEHHVAANLSRVASAVYEATTRYLGWEMYWHEQNCGATDGHLFITSQAANSRAAGDSQSRAGLRKENLHEQTIPSGIHA